MLSKLFGGLFYAVLSFFKSFWKERQEAKRQEKEHETIASAAREAGKVEGVAATAKTEYASKVADAKEEAACPPTTSEELTASIEKANKLHRKKKRIP